MPANPSSPQEYQVFDPETNEIRVMVFQPPKRRYWLHILLFLLTLLSTLAIGARWQYDFNRSVVPFSDDPYWLPWSWALADWRRLALGIPFAACVLGILTAHELGHYLLCVRRKVFATWPFFIPFPSPIGTMGAFILIRSPFRNRRDLFDIAIAGPIAGFAVAVPVLFFSLLASKPLPSYMGDSVFFGFPAIFHVAHWLLVASGSHAAAAQLGLGQLYFHPTVVAAWVGMLATAMNLIPGGQLDGGHILYAINPRAHRVISWLLIPALLVLSWYFWLGWFIWAVGVRLTINHPRVPNGSGLGTKRKLLAVFALLMLALTFMYDPLLTGSLTELLHHSK